MNKSKCLKITSLLIGLGFSVSSFADEITLVDGKVISGKFKAANDSSVFIVVDGKGKTFPIDSVKTIQLDKIEKKKKLYKLSVEKESEILVRLNKSITDASKKGDKVIAAILQSVVIDRVQFQPGAFLVGSIVKDNNKLRVKWSSINQNGDEYQFTKGVKVAASTSLPDNYYSESKLYIATSHKKSKKINKNIVLEGKKLNIPRGAIINLVVSNKNKA